MIEVATIQILFKMKSNGFRSYEHKTVLLSSTIIIVLYDSRVCMIEGKPDRNRNQIRFIKQLESTVKGILKLSALVKLISRTKFSFYYLFKDLTRELFVRLLLWPTRFPCSEG
jgi:hypothetical protein